jgi:hypothetical protein
MRPMTQMINPSKKPDYPKVQGSATIPDPIIVFQHVNIVVIDDYFFGTTASTAA